MKYLQDNKKSLIVALDDINYLFQAQVANKVVYDILRAYEEYPGVKSSIFAILSDLEFKYAFDKNVNTVFIPQEVLFPLYTYSQIEDILMDRVNAGFFPDVIPEDILVVGIENMENFRMIRQQRKLFESVLGDKTLLFVSRYPLSTDLRNWLKGIPNKYVHFGDFDLAGIHIFMTEFYKYLGERSKYLIPSDIEQRLAKGSQDRYNNHFDRYHTLRCDIPYLQSLIDIINKYHRGYDQEGYINI